MLDATIIALYLAVMLGVGFMVSRRGGEDDFFLAGRAMPSWAVSLSVVATALSAATFVGVPQLALTGNLSYLATYIGALIATALIALWFVPALYREGTLTIYGMLTRRFGESVTVAAAVLFLVGRMLSSGARLFMAAIVFALMWRGSTHPRDLVPVLLVIGGSGMVYTMAGGLRAVIWTDALQFFVMIGGGVLCLVMLQRDTALPLSDLLSLWRAAPGGSKLTVIDPSLAIQKPYTIWAAAGAMVMVTLATHGVDQDMLQRVMAARSAGRGALALMASTLVTIPVVMLFLLIGLWLYAWFRVRGIDPATLPDSQNLFPRYVLEQVPRGARGLVLAGLLAAAMSTFDSAINAMAGCFLADVWRPLRARWRRSLRANDDTPGTEHGLAVPRGLVGLVGVLLTGFAVLAVFMHESSRSTLIDFALGVMAFAHAPLLGVFLAALFTRRGTAVSALLAMAIGVLGVLLLQPWLFEPLFGFRIAWPWWWVIVSPVVFLLTILPAGEGEKVQVSGSCSADSAAVS
ncbi:MAG TPA: hypothetical protein PK379_09610 [Candidatus Hydrogenedentes bacterium]|nr:hypothetical protein [Candidatus Hydrogenedentota bacterium]HOK90271.1 hypothetical protein [Candidatus Hydrogenedentota bacterium]